MKINKGLLLALTAIILIGVSGLCFAQDATLTAVTNNFNTGADNIISIICGPIGKVLAVVILLIGIGKLLKQELIWALVCGVAFMLLAFLPTIIANWPKGTVSGG